MKIQKLAHRLMTKSLRNSKMKTGTIEKAPRLNLLELEDRSVPAIGYFQGFETDTTDWNPAATRVSSGTNGVTSLTGANHAEITAGAFTRFDGYTSTFPAGGFSTINYVYLNVSGGNPNDTRFDYTSAINTPAGTHRRDFAFNVGFYNDTDVTGAGARFVISASNSTGRGNSFPKNPGRAPFAITATGWYGFEHRFYDSGAGQLACQLTLRDATGTILNSWVLSDPTDVIGSTVGGNRYGWFPNIEFGNLKIDNTAQFSIATPVNTYVDANWVGLPYGVDPDGAGPANSVGVDSFATIQTGINAVAAGGTVNVNGGTYVGNVAIQKPLSLLSTSGKASTVIQGVAGVGQLGAVQLVGPLSGVTVGAAGQGFTIVGFDNADPGLENAALYLQGNQSNVVIRDNEIQANGDLGLLSEFGATVSNLTIDGNLFSGQTFVGTPAGLGTSQQFTLHNVPRQVVVISGGSGGGNTSNVTFTNNTITATAGGLNASSQEQGNTLVTIDANGATISGNTFDGTTTRLGVFGLRARGPNTTVSGNTFDNSGLSSNVGYLFLQNTGQTSQQAFSVNTFTGGVYVAGAIGAVFTTLQGAVNSSPAGTTIVVPAGNYAENVSVPRTLTFDFQSGATLNPASGNALTVSAGTTTILGSVATGSRPTVIQTGATLKGTGAISGPVTVDAGGTHTPGLSPGIQATGNYNLAGTLVVEADNVGASPVAGGNYDQVQVTGSVTLSGTLSVSLTGPINAGAALTIISNDGVDPIVGTFAGLTGGSTFVAGGQTFAIFYNAGDGNDVVLVAVPTASPLSTVYADDDWASLANGVDPDGAGPRIAIGYDSFGTIQNGVNAVVAGGTVYVAAGTFTENVGINKSVTLNGANEGLSGTSGSRGAESTLSGEFRLLSSGITIDGFRITGAGRAVVSQGTGPWSNITIENNVMSGNTGQQAILNGFGVVTNTIGSSNWTIIDNLIDDIQSSSSTAIALFNIDNLTITGNTINHTNTSFTGRRGINLDGIQTAQISNNSIDMGDPSPTGSTNTPWAIQLSMSDRTTSDITIENNSIENTYYGIVGLSQRSLSDVTVSQNTISDVAVGAAFNSGGVAPVVSGTSMSNISIEENFIDASLRGVLIRNLHNIAANGPVTYSNVDVLGNSIEMSGGLGIAVESGTSIAEGAVDASGNWWGTNVLASVQSLISGTVDYSPFLLSGVDADAGTAGFQADYSDLTVSDDGNQTGTTGRIQEALNLVGTGGTVNVAAGTYLEDVLVGTSGVSLLGAGPTSSVISGVIGGDGATVRVGASNVTVAGFTITREGNNTTDWNNPGLNSAGIAIQNQTGATIHDNLITGNRTAIDVNNASNHIIRNNVITDNRTGLIFRNQTDNLTVVENEITDNWTVGVLFLDASGGTNSPVQSAANSVFSNNDISGNWYGQIVDRQDGGALPAAGTTNLKNFSGNWLGTTTPVVTNANSTEPGYSAQIPVAFGGTATAPGGQPDVAGTASANFDLTPLLSSGTDSNVETTPGRGTYGFQGDHSSLKVLSTGAQTGTTGRIQEGVNLVNTDGTVNVDGGSYAESVTTNKPVTLLGANEAISPNTGVRVPETNITGGLSIANGTLGTITVRGFEFTGVTSPLQTNNNVQAGLTTVDFSRNRVVASSGQLSLQTGTSGAVIAATISDNLFENAAGNAMQLNAGGGGVTSVDITDNTIDTTLFTGIESAGLTNSTIERNTISNTGRQSIQIAGAAANVSITGNTIINANTTNDPNRGGLRFTTTSYTGPVTATENFVSGFNAVSVPTGATIPAGLLSLSGNHLIGTGGSFAVRNNATTGTLNTSGNWFGSDDLATVTAGISGNVDYSPYLNDGTDTSATAGFQGDFSDLTVHPDGAQDGGTGRITEGYNALAATGTIHVRSGSYTENVDLGAGSNKAVNLEAGASPGVVTINGNLTLTNNDTLTIDLAGANPGQYDQFIVNGNVALGGSQLVLNPTFTPTVASKFTLIDNDSNDAVAGTFAGLAEGSLINAGGYAYKISYVGGTGNDVVLTRNLPPTNFTLSNNIVPENSGPNFLVGTFSTIDPDVGDSFTYTFRNGAGDTDNGSFTIVGNQLFANPNFNFEVKSSYSIRVRSTDASGEFIPRVFTINVSNVNDTPTDITSTVLTVAENATNGTGVGSVTGVDPDTVAPWNTLTYSLIDDAGGLFAIDANTGVITVDNELLLNYELNTSHAITVRVTDGGTPGLFYDENFIVTVLNVNEVPYDITSPGLTLPENSPNNAVAGSVTGFDFDNVAPFNSLTYSLVDDAGGLFAITPLSGVVTVVDGSLLNYEVATDHQIMVRVTDGGGLFLDVPFAVVINDVNEAPTDLNASPLTVVENSPNGTVVGSVTGDDPDTTSPFNTLTYSLTDNAGGRFAINPTTGEITVANSSLLNFEANTSHTITVLVTDGGGLFYSENFNVAVTNVNEAPTAIQLSSTSLPENAGTNFVVGTLTSSDQDAGESFTYTLVAGAGSADNGFFNIVGDQLRASSSFNFESQNVFEIRIRTSDSGGLTYSQPFIITVTNVNEAPTALSLSNNVLAENAGPNAVVGTFSSTDPDTNPQTFTYSIVGGPDAAFFNVSGNQLRATNSLNFEAQPTYSILVRTTDQGGLFFEQTFTITATDVNEAPTDITATPLSIVENSANGISVGTAAGVDTDTNAPNNTLTYSLTNSAGGRFAINPTIGAITVANGSLLNFEADSSHSITVQVTDGGGLSFSKGFTVNVTDVNETPTAVLLSNQSLPENAAANAVVGTLSSNDPDSGNTFSYTLVGLGNDNALFNISGNQLRANAGFDFETQSSYTVRIRTTDQGGLFTAQNFTITVTDVNEAPTDITTTALSVAENSANGTTVGTATGVDPDILPPNSTLTYSLTNNAGGRFAINPTTGVITVANGALLNYEANTSHPITVQVTDGGSLTYSEGFTVNVTNANEAPTNITLTPSTVQENVSLGTLVGNFATTDPDGDVSFTYSFRSGAGDTDNGSFTIVGNQLYTNANFDFEAKSSYSIRVRSTDAGGLFTAKIFTIAVTNVNEEPTNIVPVAQTVNEDTALVFNGAKTISVSDLEGAMATVQLTVTNGRLTVNLAGGATISSGANNSASLTLLGNQTQINAALATLTYQGSADYYGSDTLTIVSSDSDVIPQTDTDTVAITITPVADIVNDNLLLNGLSTISANLITGTNGASADTFSNSGRTLTAVSTPSKGTVTFAANGTINYTPNFAFTGSDTFTYTVTSAGNTETGTVTVSGASQSTFLTSSSTSGQPVRQYSVAGMGSPATATGVSFTVSGASRVAYGDVNGDGTEDIIVGSVTGSTSIVRVYNGKNSVLMNSFTPFVTGAVSGIFVAAGDANGDGKADVTVGNGSIGTGANSNVRVYDGAYLSSGKAVVSASIGGTQIAQGRLRDFYGLSNATGSSVGNGTTFTANTGVTVAMGDFNGDGRSDIVVGTVNGGSSRVVIYDSKVLLGTNGTTAWPKPNVDLTVYNVGTSTGVSVAAGDVDGDGRAELITGALSGGANVRVFTFAAGSKALPTSAHAVFTNVSGGITTTTLSGTAPTLSADFLVGATNAGVRVAARDLNNDGYADILFTFASNQPGVASTYVGTVDGNGLRMAYASTPYQLQLAPPFGSAFTLLTAAYAGVSTGAFIA